MTRGDVADDGGAITITAGGVADIRPPSGIEWVIHNIIVDDESDVELQKYDGTTPISFETRTGGWMGEFFHCTYNRYYRVKNLGSTSISIMFDGIVTKE